MLRPGSSRPLALRTCAGRVVAPVLLLSSLIACASTAPRQGDTRVDEGAVVDAADEGAWLPENVATAILMGSSLLESGDVRGALPYYAFAFEQAPDDLEIGRRYVEVALRAGRGQEALAALDRILSTHPDQIDLSVQRVRIIGLLGETALAERESAALLRDHPDDFAVLDLRSETLIGAQQWQLALEIVDRMLAQRPDEAALWSRRAALLDAMERVEESEQAWRRTLDLDPGDIDAVDRLSELLRQQGRTDELIALLEDLRARVEVGPLVQARLADLYLGKGDLERTVDLLQPLADRGELDPRARVILADLLANLDREEEALATLEELEASGATGLPVLRMKGELQAELGRYAQAESTLVRAIAEDPEDPEAHVGLVLAMSQAEPALLRGEGTPARQERFARAIEDARGLVSPQSVRQNYLLGAILRRTGDLAAAEPLLRRAGELASDNRQVLYDLAVTQEGLRDYRGAVATLERLLELDPEDAHLQNFYGYLLADQGWELEKAERLIRSAVEKEPDNGAYVDSLGWVLYRNGRLEEALEHLIRAANLVGDDATVLEHLGDCLRDLGRSEEALRTYRRALQIGGDAERLQPRIEAVEETLRGAP